MQDAAPGSGHGPLALLSARGSLAAAKPGCWESSSSSKTHAFPRRGRAAGTAREHGRPWGAAPSWQRQVGATSSRAQGKGRNTWIAACWWPLGPGHLPPLQLPPAERICGCSLCLRSAWSHERHRSASWRRHNNPHVWVIGYYLFRIIR